MARTAADLDKFEADCEQQLTDFLHDHSRATYEFPTTLSNLQRKVVHRVADRLQLSHTSVGLDAERRIVCSKETAPSSTRPAPCHVSGLSMRQRIHFVKDFSLPIPTTHSPYFEFFLDWYQDLLGTRDLLAGVLQDIVAFGGEDKFVEHLQAKKKAIVGAIRSTDAFRRFQADPMPHCSVADLPTCAIPSCNTWKATEANQFFLSIDLSSANFFALKHYDPDLVLGADTYEALVQRFSPCFWLRRSKMLRQIICSELHQPGQNRIIAHTVQSLATLLHSHCSVPLEQFHGINHDEILLRTSAASWRADMARYSAALLAQTSPAVTQALKLEAYTVRQLTPKPYFVKEVLLERRLTPGNENVEVEVDGSVQRVIFKCVPPAHFAQAFDHYASSAARCLYVVDRSTPLYPKCLRVTEFAKHLAVFPDLLFSTTPPREPPQVACAPRPEPITEKARRHVMNDHRFPVFASHSPYFEHFVDFYEPFFGTRTVLQRYINALPTAATWRKSRVGIVVPDTPAADTLVPVWRALCDFVHDDGAHRLALDVPTDKAERSLFFSLLRGFGVLHCGQAGSVVCTKELPAFTEATAGLWEETARDWGASCLGIVTSAIRSTTPFAAFETLPVEELLDVPLLGQTPRATKAQLPVGLRPWSGFAQQAEGHFVQIRLGNGPFYALRAFSPDLVLGAKSLDDLFYQCCGDAAHPYLWRNPQLCERLYTALGPQQQSLIVQHLLRLAVTALCTAKAVEPSEVALDRSQDEEGILIRSNHWTALESAQAAATTIRRLLADLYAGHIEPEDISVEVFQVTHKENGWLAESDHPHGNGERRLLYGNIAPEVLPQYLRWYCGQPLEEVDRLVWPESGAERWLLVEPVPSLWPT